MQAINPWGEDGAGGLATLNKLNRQAELDDLNRRRTEQDMAQQQMTMDELSRKQQIRDKLVAEVQGVQGKEGLSVFDKQQKIDEAHLSLDPLAEVSKGVDVTVPAMKASGNKLNAFALIALTSIPKLKQGATVDQLAQDPTIKEISAKMGVNPQDAANYMQNAKPFGNGVIMMDREAGLAHIVSVGKDGQLDQKVMSMPKAEKQELWGKPYEGTIGGKKVLLRENLITGKTEMVAQDISTTVKVGVGGGQQDAPIPSAIEKRLSGAYSTAELANRLSDGYKPEYSAVREWFGTKAPKTAAAAAQAAQKQFGENSPAALFWMDYQNYVNAVRKELFGTALSKHEQSSFDAAIINPGMSPDTIQKSLDKQADIVTAGYERTRSGQVFGKQKRAVETAYPTINRTPKQPQAPAGNVIRYDKNGRRI